MNLEPFYRFRQGLADALERDLVGPKATDELREDETLLVDDPVTRYLAGILFPLSTEAVDQEQDQDVSEDYDETTTPDPPVAMANVKYPSSMGLTFAVDAEQSRLHVKVTAAAYTPETPDEPGEPPIRGKRRKRLGVGGGRWRHRPLEPAPVELDVSTPTGDERRTLTVGLDLFWRIRPARNGVVSVTLGLVNDNRLPVGEFRRDEYSFFHPTIEVTGADGSAPFVARHRAVSQADDPDLRSYRLLYRHAAEFATGHGCSVDWIVAPDDPERATEVHIEHVPRFELPIADSNPALLSPWFTMLRLAESPREEVVAGLGAFCDEYAGWVAARRDDAGALEGELRNTAEEHLLLCEEAHRRMSDGVELLARDDNAFEAFRLANRAMAEQRARSETSNGATPDQPPDMAVHAWRPFQLGFILSTLEGVADRHHRERDLVDLLWFPTGGGKTEAYLGLIAFTTFLRRLNDPAAGGGVTVLMRYTLRLLTIQQFERAALLICVCENLRRRNPTALGATPIGIGLWVGQDGTPNNLRQARKALDDLRAGKKIEKQNPVQLQRCPWCGRRLDHRNYWIRDNDSRMMITCGNDDCEFAKGLPVYIVDDDIYNGRPTLIIATADKYAGLPWRDKATELFNVGHPEPPPELIIQDELHLISGPLGTLAGLYETAVDLLCRSEDDTPPKVIASTATIRRAQSQVLGLFSRDVRQFPPPGLDVRDSWFAVERPRDQRGTRQYLGLMAPATSQTTLLVRTYGVLLQQAAELPADPEHRDPYWTLLGYFNSLRVLGGARMQVQDDVPGYMAVVARRDEATERSIDDVEELTSRVPSSAIPGILAAMDQPYGTQGVLDLILATNMISVGVDVSRLGLMAVMGQPQSASEYIQATSRIGRRYPGLVAVIFNAARSRDRSHFESFTAFHSALYRQVDSSSVTPFSPRARDRGLHAVLVALTRLTVAELRPNDAAGNVAALEFNLPRVKERILERVRRVDPAETDAVARNLDELIEQWLHRARTVSGLRYSNPNDEDKALLVDATVTEPEPGQFPTLWSLRDVDTESGLYLVRN